MSQPNLFSFATSELSQDAFICWFLAWASPEYAKFDEELHQCAQQFVTSLFLKHGKSAPRIIKKVDVKRQDNNIDILCIVNDTFPILIEDKTDSENHSDQLSRYLEIIKSRGYELANIIPIYFKTRDQASYEEVIGNDYQPYLRLDFLKVLDMYTGENSILIDYRLYLQTIDDEVESYKSTHIDEWEQSAWVGFYLKLQGNYSPPITHK